MTRMKTLPFILLAASLLGGSLAVGNESYGTSIALSEPFAIKKGGTLTERIATILVETLPIKADQVVPTARLVEDLGADLYDLVQIVMEVEDEFKISIPDEDAERISTVGDLTDYVAKKLTSFRY